MKLVRCVYTTPKVVALSVTSQLLMFAHRFLMKCQNETVSIELKNGWF